MIYGIGTDIVVIDRLRALYERHGERASARILGLGERREVMGLLAQGGDVGRFLAKRFAAKEAFGKAMGTGIRAPVTLPGIEIVHDQAGKPAFKFSDQLATILRERCLETHLSITDEQEHALAFVIIEKTQ